MENLEKEDHSSILKVTVIRCDEAFDVCLQKVRRAKEDSKDPGLSDWGSRSRFLRANRREEPDFQGVEKVIRSRSSGSSRSCVPLPTSSFSLTMKVTSFIMLAQSP